MRAFLVLCMVAVCAADVSELSQSGYKYAQPSGSGSESGFDIISPAELGSASSVDPSLAGLGMSGSDFDGSSSSPAQGTASKRFFTINAQDNEDGDDDDSTTASEGQKNYDVVFARAPPQSLKSALKAFSKYAGEQQTAVYILSKQLGAAEIGNALRTSGIKPSKPQVHFIKYRTPEEAALAQQRIKSQYDALHGPSQFGGEESAPVESVIGAFRSRRPSSNLGGFNYHSAGSLHSNRYLPPRY